MSKSDKKHTKNQKHIRVKFQTHLSCEPARGARRRPGCLSELRRAKRAGAQTGIRAPGGMIPIPPNKKMLAPEYGTQRFKKCAQPLAGSGKYLIRCPGCISPGQRFGPFRLTQE